MDVIVEIADGEALREALPVWALPEVTSWHLTTYMLLDRLVKSSS